MRYLLVLLLAGCAPLGNLSPDTVNAIANAGGGCAKVTGLWGSGIVMIGSVDRGVIRNGSVDVAAECGGVSIKNTAKPAP